MPVLITGATGFVGRALAQALLDDGAQVRAYLRRDDTALRAMGVHIAKGSSEVVEPLEMALTQVHTIVHLIGGWSPERAVTHDYLNRDSTETTVIAAKAANVQRFVFLSSLGADPESSNPFLKAKGLAEQHITTSGLPFIILRCAPIWGESAPVAAALGAMTKGPLTPLPGSGKQRIALIALEDVIAALLAADTREQIDPGTFDLAGPSPYPLSEIATAAGAKRTMHAGRVGGAVGDLLGRDLLAGPNDAAERFGLTLRAPL